MRKVSTGEKRRGIGGSDIDGFIHMLIFLGFIEIHAREQGSSTPHLAVAFH